MEYRSQEYSLFRWTEGPNYQIVMSTRKKQRAGGKRSHARSTQSRSVRVGDINDSNVNIAAGNIEITYEGLTVAQRTTIRSIVLFVSALACLAVTWMGFQLQFLDINRLFRLPTRLLFSILGIGLACLALAMLIQVLPPNRLRKALIWALIIPAIVLNGFRFVGDSIQVFAITTAPELVYDENDTGTYRGASEAYLQRGQWYLYSGNYEKASIDINRSREIQTMLSIRQDGEPDAAPPENVDTIAREERELYHWLLFVSLQGMHLNEVDLSPQSDHRFLEVKPGERITGEGMIEVYLDSTARLITPVALTVSWDDSVRNEIADGLEFAQAKEFGAMARNYYFRVDVAAPAKAGTHYLIIISGAMYNIQQILTFSYAQQSGVNDIWHVPPDAWQGKIYGGHLDHSFVNVDGLIEPYKWPAIAVEIHVKE